MEPKIDGDNPKPDELDAPKRDGEELASNGGVDDVPNIEGVVDEVDPRTRVLGVLNAPLDAKTTALEAPNALPVLPNVGLGVEPKAEVFVAPNAGVVLAAQNVGVLDDIEEPNRLLINVGCAC